MTTTTHETEVFADPDVPLVRITREFDAPPEKVFRAHTDPDLVVQWLGPRRHGMTIDHYDCRTGGSYRYIHSSDGNEYVFYGSFHVVRAPETMAVAASVNNAYNGCLTPRHLRGSGTVLKASKSVSSAILLICFDVVTGFGCRTQMSDSAISISQAQIALQLASVD